MVQAWRKLSLSSDLIIYLDDDDPEAPNYRRYKDPRITVEVGPRRRLVAATNYGVETHPDYEYYGSMGDDHIPMTEGWDTKLIERIESNNGWGIAYGDDLLKHEQLPTACIMSANIIQAIGYMCLPALIHLYVDDFWKELGAATGMLFYEPSVVVEHVHPFGGKVPMDEGYKESNSIANFNHDHEVFIDWKNNQKQTDIERIRTALLQTTTQLLQ